MALNRVSLGFIGFCSILYRFYSNFLGLTKIFGFYGISSFDEGLLRVVIIFFQIFTGFGSIEIEALSFFVFPLGTGRRGSDIIGRPLGRPRKRVRRCSLLPGPRREAVSLNGRVSLSP